MQWIKSHLVLVIVGAVSFLSLVALVLGFLLSNVSEDLESDARLLSSLSAVRPVNARRIEEARKQQKIDAQLLDQFIAQHREAGKREPLNRDVFTSTDQVKQQGAIFSFQDSYPRQLQRLLKQVLNGLPSEAKSDIEVSTDAPTEAEFQAYEQAWKARKDKEMKELTMGLGGGAAQVPVAPVGQHGGVQLVRPTATPGLGAGGMGTAAEEELKQLRMACAIDRARSLRCYAAVENMDDRSEDIRPKGRPPAEIILDMWYAQVALWVEEDILRGLAGLNDRVAKELPQEERWVAFLPVKHVKQFRLGNYIAPAAGGTTGMGSTGPVRFPGAGGGMGAMGGGASSDSDALLTAPASVVFTGRGSTASVDVLRFSITLVIDDRRLLQVLNAIADAGFYTPVNVDFDEIPAGQAGNYIYGTAPTVQVKILCEASFLRGAYEQWMPAEVKTAISMGQAGGMSRGGTSGYGQPSPHPGGFSPPFPGTPPGGTGRSPPRRRN